MPAQHHLLAVATALMSLSSATAILTPAPAVAQQGREAWLQRQFANNDSQLLAQPVGAPDKLTDALATWDWLRRTPPVGRDPSLSAQSRFVATYPDWPGVTAIKRRAETQAANQTKTSDGEALAYFRSVPPETSAGMARMALLSSGPDAEKWARAAWGRTGIPTELENQILGRFGSQLTRQDHAARADALIWAGQTSAAARLLPMLDDETRSFVQARIALRSGAPDAEARLASVPARFRRNAGLIFDQVGWLERRGQLSQAESLLAAGDTEAGTTAPVTWLDKRLTLGRAAMRRGNHDLAYRILSNHKTYAPGVAVSTLPLSERVKLSDTEWLAGWIALRKLARYDAAARNFTLFNQAVTTPVSQSRGDYWLGRAEKARGNKAAANVAFERAARQFDYFYGQLAAEELGRLPQLPMVPIVKPTQAERTQFESQPLASAMAFLVGMGETNRVSLFARAVGDSVATPTEARIAAEMGQRLNRPDVGVWTWKNARPRGDLSTFDLAYPRLPAAAPITPRDWFVVHGITRQESSFDRTALSSAGARGLMQLMPATAQDVSSKLGLPFSRDRLFSDPVYNITLGNYYIGLRRDNFSNAALAIAAYNAGAGNVRKWLAANGDPRISEDAVDWVEMIPIQETRNYVQRVVENGVVYSLLEPKRPYAEPRASKWLRGY